MGFLDHLQQGFQKMGGMGNFNPQQMQLNQDPNGYNQQQGLGGMVQPGGFGSLFSALKNQFGHKGFQYGQQDPTAMGSQFGDAAGVLGRKGLGLGEQALM